MTQAFKFSRRSIRSLAKVHPDLMWVLYKALEATEIDFTIIHGIRTAREEQELVFKGASTTMHSRHLPNKNGFACAVDIACWQAGDITWAPSVYIQQATYFKEVAAAQNVPLEWGGDWNTFKDYGHFQLPWRTHP